MSYSVIITAGGVGKRMQADRPKQFLVLKGKPILMHTIERFYKVDTSIQIIVVLPQDQLTVWKNICRTHNFIIQHQTVAGGKERFHSVQKGLALVNGEYTAVHDAVRPLVSATVIKNCFSALETSPAIVPVVDMKQSIRQVVNGQSKSVDRSNYKMVQTPQCFTTALLKQAYQQPFNPIFTDDASVVEHVGEPITLIEGNEENIKITTPADLKIAALFLAP